MERASASPDRMIRGRIRVAIGLAIAVAGCSPAAVAPRNVVLISIDTLRPDHLGCYGYARATSPAIDRLAGQGVLYERAFAPSAWTLPSHATMLTGVDPARHGALSLRESVSTEVPLLAETLQRAGFATAGIVNGEFLRPRFGFGRGFERYEVFHVRKWREHQAAALAALGRFERRPFFLFVHYMSVHAPYEPEARFDRFTRPQDRGRLDTSGPELRKLKAAIGSGSRTLDREEIEYLIGLYDGGILHTDHLVGELLAALDAADVGETLVVLTADHGEELMEHGSLLHNDTLYDELIAVPLILRGRGIPAGVRDTSLVGLVDVVPTLLDWLGLQTPTRTDGHSLLGSWRHAEPADRLLSLMTGYPQDGRAKLGVRSRNTKLVVDRIAGRTQFYDLEADPLETVSDFPSERAEPLLRRLADFDPGSARPQFELDTERRAALRELGYVD